MCSEKVQCFVGSSILCLAYLAFLVLTRCYPVLTRLEAKTKWEKTVSSFLGVRETRSWESRCQGLHPGTAHHCTWLRIIGKISPLSSDGNPWVLRRTDYLNMLDSAAAACKGNFFKTGEFAAEEGISRCWLSWDPELTK